MSLRFDGWLHLATRKSDKLKVLPFNKDKHLPFKINNEIKVVYVDENLHNLILPTVIVILTLIFFLQV